MDRKTIIGVALCLLLLVLYRPLLRWVGLEHYLESPRQAPVSAVDTTRRDTSRIAGAAAPPPPARLESSPASPPSAGSQAHAAPERLVDLETPLYHARFSSRGARLVSVELKRYASAHGASSRGVKGRRFKSGREIPPGDRVVLAGGPLFGLDLGSGKALQSLADMDFAVAESLDAAGSRRVVTFTAQDSGGPFVRETYRVRPDTYALDLEVELRGVPANSRILDYSLTSRSWPLLTESDVVSDARTLRASSLVGTNIHRERAVGLLKTARDFDGNAAWEVVQSRYFMSGVAIHQGDARGVQSRAELRSSTTEELALAPPGAKPEQPVAVNSLVVGLPPESRPVQRFVFYAGPAEYFGLAGLKSQLEGAVDLGWPWILPFARFLLRVLNWLDVLLQNYGLSIIALATLVRVLLHPLNMMSMKSMRAMQRLQPEMERIKEKYKNDASAMNAAVMALYKENKVNPAGGCLPMLLQMPLFVALYQVLFNAIELRLAPFVAWMQDLSAPDLLFTIGPLPIRLLPLLMAGSGILSQRVTPTDPRQLPSMYMMNVMMLVFFYNLPSGLVLYWTVMNLLTALQQWMVLRQDAAVPVPAAAAPARASTPGSKKRRAEGRTG